MPNVWENNAFYKHSKVSTCSGRPLEIINGLNIPAHDYIGMTYSGATLTGVVYKKGGSGGATVASLSLTYSGSNLIEVIKG